jgi:hypothetical protein
MIKKISFSKLTHNELQTLCSRIIQAVESVAVINAGVVATILTMLKASYEKFLPLANRSHKSGFKDLLKEKNTHRGDAFRALRDVILGLSRRLHDIQRASARHLLEIFTRNGWTIYLNGYQDQSAELNGLIKELEGKEAMNSITVLQLVDMLNELKTSQKDFEDTYQTKVNGNSKEEFSAIDEIRPKLVKQLSDLLERIDSDAEYSKSSDDYTNLINTLNNIISETATVLKSRLTRDNGSLPESEHPVELVNSDNGK